MPANCKLNAATSGKAKQLPVGLLLCITSLLFSLSSRAQSPFWHWQRALSGTGQEMCADVATDQSGNAIVTGYFSSPTLSIGSYTLSNKGQNDIFLAKYDVLGTVLWARSFGDSLMEEGNSVFTDASGNIYLCGSYSSYSVSFITDTVFNTNQSKEHFVAKLDGSGNVLWVRHSKGRKDETGKAVATNSIGEVYVAGNFKSDTLVYGTTTLVNGAQGSNTNDYFLLKYDANGTLLWARSGRGAGADEVSDMAMDASGNVAVCGTFTSSTLTIGSNTLMNNGTASNVFVARYNTFGTPTWARSEGGTADEYGNAVACESNGNVIITGNYSGTMIISGNNTLTAANPNLQYSFLIKYNPIGVVMWTKQISGSTLSSNALCCDVQGYVTVGGSFSGSLAVSQLTANGSSAEEAFVAKYYASSAPFWLRTITGSSDERCRSVSTDANGNIHVVGISSSPVLAFSGSTLAMNYAPGWEGFVSRLGVNPSGFETIAEDKKFSFYPNPSSGLFYLDCKEAAELRVSNLLGQEVYSATVLASHHEIDLRGKARGVYFIQLSSAKESHSFKVILD